MRACNSRAFLMEVIEVHFWRRKVAMAEISCDDLIQEEKKSRSPISIQTRYRPLPAKKKKAHILTFSSWVLYFGLI